MKKVHETGNRAGYLRTAPSNKKVELIPTASAVGFQMGKGVEIFDFWRQEEKSCESLAAQHFCRMPWYLAR